MTLRFAALSGETLHLSLILDHREEGPFEALQLGLDLMIGTDLTHRLTIAYAADTAPASPLLVEEALHSYLHVGDAQAVTVQGLAGTEFLDKTDDFKRKQQQEEYLRFAGETDRPYLNTTADVTLADPVLRRRLRLQKQNSRTTVAWNPGAILARTLADLAPDDWQRFVCLETANAAENALRLLPGEAHSMSSQLSVLPFDSTV